MRGEVNSNDIGLYQINTRYHLKKAKELGYDIFTEEGNTAYAIWLYGKEGTKPWNASKHCWGKEQGSS